MLAIVLNLRGNGYKNQGERDRLSRLAHLFTYCGWVSAMFNPPKDQVFRRVAVVQSYDKSRI